MKGVHPRFKLRLPASIRPLGLLDVILLTMALRTRSQAHFSGFELL